MNKSPSWAYVFWIVVMGVAAVGLVAALVSAAAVVPLIVIGFPLTLTAVGLFLLIGYIRHKRR